jgi:mRNA deadenylase 3'-5' endonuclease subunit Ccr4
MRNHLYTCLIPINAYTQLYPMSTSRIEIDARKKILSVELHFRFRNNIIILIFVQLYDRSFEKQICLYII